VGTRSSPRAAIHRRHGRLRGRFRSRSRVVAEGGASRIAAEVWRQAEYFLVLENDFSQVDVTDGEGELRVTGRVR
jgi:hypothetical protein